MPPTPKPDAAPPAPDLGGDTENPAEEAHESKLHEIVEHVEHLFGQHRAAIETTTAEAISTALTAHGDSTAKALDELDTKVKFHLDALRAEWEPLKTQAETLVTDLQAALKTVNAGNPAELADRVKQLEEDLIGMAAKVGRAIGATNLLPGRTAAPAAPVQPTEPPATS